SSSPSQVTASSPTFRRWGRAGSCAWSTFSTCSPSAGSPAASSTSTRCCRTDPESRTGEMKRRLTSLPCRLKQGGYVHDATSDLRVQPESIRPRDCHPGRGKEDRSPPLARLLCLLRQAARPDRAGGPGVRAAGGLPGKSDETKSPCRPPNRYTGCEGWRVALGLGGSRRGNKKSGDQLADRMDGWVCFT